MYRRHAKFCKIHGVPSIGGVSLASAASTEMVLHLSMSQHRVAHGRFFELPGKKNRVPVGSLVPISI
jgi:hypothetical protein